MVHKAVPQVALNRTAIILGYLVIRKMFFWRKRVCSEETERVDDEKARNAVGCSEHCCPLPLVNARKELDKLEAGQTLEVIASCPSAEKDVKILTRLKAISWFELGKRLVGFTF
jgi:TusA-related sulfurtransferase